MQDQSQPQISREEIVALVEKLYYARLSKAIGSYANSNKILAEIFQKVLNRTT